MASNEPPYLPIGTDVSAKYRGAFCEAKVKKIAKSVRCKVFIKEIQSSLIVTDEFITGNLTLGNDVEIRHPDTGRIMEGVINKMFDTSMYTVVFDDGDERTLRRTQLCLKGDRHFTESETLDNLPLSNPEQFGTPVISGKGKRRSSGIGSATQDDSDDSSEDELNDSRKSLTAYSDLVGKVMFYDAGEKKKPYLLPVLVVIPEAHPTTLKSKDHVLVRSFKDNKFLSVTKKELISFTREIVLKNEDKTLKVPMEKALLYIDNRELPVSWNKEDLFGPDYDSDFDEDKQSDEDSEPSEEEDRFVAQLYKFCDDRGTPINKAPSVGSKDLNLYKLFKIVQKLGGYNRVTNQMKWRLVYSKMLLPPSNTASTQIKNAYKKYLHAFEDFYRKLGSTMGTISRPGRNRHDSGRSILNFRGREKEALAREVIAKEAAKELEKSLDSSKDEIKSEKADDSLSEVDTESEQGTPGGTPKRPKSARLKPEVRLIKDDKELKIDKKDKKDSNKKDEPKSMKKTLEVNNEKTEVKEENVKEGKTQEEKQDEGKKEKEDSKKQTEKKLGEKKEAKVKMTKKDVEEEKDSRQLGRRRITRTDEEADEKKEKKGESKEEAKPKKTEQKSKETDKEGQKATGKDDKKVVKKDVVKVVTKKDEKTEKVEKTDDDEDAAPPPAPGPTIPGLNDLPLGTKMRVRYGRGRNQREYEAKIIEVGVDSAHRQYLVHYAGWNNRHDEWIKPERIVRIVHKPDLKGGVKLSTKILKKPGKSKLSEKSPASPSSVASSDSGLTPASGRARPNKSKSPASSAVQLPTAGSAKGRPTRSNSIEQTVVTGLQPKRRPKKSVDKMETSKGLENDENDSDKSDDEEEIIVDVEKKDQGKNSMPSIADAAVTDKIVDEIDDNKDIDRSPPQLSKVTDIVKDKMEADEKVEVKPDSKETDEPAPILNVVNREKSNEPILQKIEAQLTASNPLKVDVKEKEVKKKEAVEKKPKKGLFKVEDETVKKLEKVLELKLSPVVSKVSEESPYEFKDESEVEPEIHRERKKPVVLMEDYRKESPRKESPRKESPRRICQDNEGSNLLQKIEMVEKEEVGIVPVVKNLTEVKDFSKSDSEVEKVERVERRGRKRKDVKEREQKEKELREKEIRIMQENAKKGKIVQADKVAVVTEAKVAGSPEKRAFITLAERKQVYSPSKTAFEDLETAKLQKIATDTGAENKTEQRKPIDTVVVHKAFDVVKGLVDIDPVSKPESGVSSDLMTPTIVRGGALPVNAEEKQESAETEKKKVRKRPRKKESREEVMLNLYGPKKKLGGRRRRNTDNQDKNTDNQGRNTDNQDKESVEISANIENKTDIDLLCDEKIRSRSASPESRKPNINVDDSQGFGPLFEAVECKLKESQQNQEIAASREFKPSFKGNLFENTPPSTPEHDSDGASQNSQEPVKNSASVSALDTRSKLGVSQPVGSESPWGIGNTSPSSGSSGVIASSEGSIDVVVNTTKRRRESDDPTPTKRRKRLSRNKSFNRSKVHESDSEEASNLSAKCRSPHYSSDSYASRSSQLANRIRSPRPPKYNFNLEEGKYLEGSQRISFLVDKIQEIRKIYMGLKAEVTCIDRRRKRARRREKERENARNITSSGEVECS